MPGAATTGVLRSSCSRRSPMRRLRATRTRRARIIAEYGRIELEARRFSNVAMLFRLFAGNTHRLALPPREAQRMKINLCQALNRIGAHEEVLTMDRHIA